MSWAGSLRTYAEEEELGWKPGSHFTMRAGGALERIRKQKEDAEGAGETSGGER